jgi:putative transcriptional regulator
VLSQLKDIAEDLVKYLSTQGATLPEAASVSHDPDPHLIRHALGLSQVGFARAMGISPKTLHKWEQGTSRPSGAARTLLRIAASDPATVKRALAAR